MGVASWQKCPEGKSNQMVWIENLEKCSESGKCSFSTCKYNRPKKKKGGGRHAYRG